MLFGHHANMGARAKARHRQIRLPYSNWPTTLLRACLTMNVKAPSTSAAARTAAHTGVELGSVLPKLCNRLLPPQPKLSITELIQFVCRRRRKVRHIFDRPSVRRSMTSLTIGYARARLGFCVTKREALSCSLGNVLRTPWLPGKRTRPSFSASCFDITCQVIATSMSWRLKPFATPRSTSTLRSMTALAIP